MSPLRSAWINCVKAEMLRLQSRGTTIQCSELVGLAYTQRTNIRMKTLVKSFTYFVYL
jgi:hypothetical protein